MTYSVPRSPALGDMTCWGVDVAKWQADHQIPVANGVWNVWLVTLAGQSFSDAQAIDAAIRQVKDNWLGDETKTGYASNVSGEIFDGNPRGRVLVDWTSADGLTWRTGPQKTVRVSFVYRGSRKSIPWPTFSATLAGGLNDPCPKNVQAAVTHVIDPSADQQEKKKLGDVPQENLCDVPYAWVKYPALCIKPGGHDGFKMPWWGYVIGGAAVLYFVSPYIKPFLPVATELGKSAAESISRARKKRKS